MFRSTTRKKAFVDIYYVDLKVVYVNIVYLNELCIFNLFIPIMTFIELFLDF